MMLRNLILLIIISFSPICSAQTTHSFKSDSTQRRFFPLNYGDKTWKPMLGFDAFQSFYLGKLVKFNGVRVGVEFKGVHRLGIGFYNLKEDLLFDDLYVESVHTTDTSQIRFRMNYTSLFYERVIFKTKRWEFVLPVYIGLGGLKGYVEGPDGLFYPYKKTSFSLFNAGVGAKFFLFPWLAPKVGVGARYIVNAEPSFKKAFNGFNYSFGVSILAGELYKTLFKK